MEVLYGLFIVYVLPFGIASFVLYFVMRAAVSSVIDEKLAAIKKVIRNELDTEDLDELIKLRVIELLNDGTRRSN